MQRIMSNPRPDWKSLAGEYGFDFYKTIYETDCWSEDAYYQFTLKQIEEIEAASEDLHEKCLALVLEVCDKYPLMTKLGIPEHLHKFIRDTVKNKPLSEPKHLYGRFDFAYDGVNPPKLLEYNADTPTALFETAVWQWRWLEDLIANEQLDKDADQFNSLHEKLIERWKLVVPDNQDTIYFTCMGEFEEDRGTCRYLEDTASQAGYKTKFISLEDIGFFNREALGDKERYEIKHIFKLYPWEWLINDTFGTHIPYINTSWVEPIWKMILSNKGILPLLWERYPEHPNLLPAYFESDPGHVDRFLNGFVRKPLLSREGSNITVVKDKAVLETIPGAYGKEGYIKQAIANIPYFYSADEEKKYPVIGSWIVGDDPAGMIVRESSSLVTNNWSQLVPHIIKD